MTVSGILRLGGLYSGLSAFAGSTLVYMLVPGSLTVLNVIATLCLLPALRRNPSVSTLALLLFLFVQVMLHLGELPVWGAAVAAVLFVTVTLARVSARVLLFFPMTFALAMALSMVMLFPFVQGGVVSPLDWPIPRTIVEAEGGVRTHLFSIPWGVTVAMTGAVSRPLGNDLLVTQMSGWTFSPSTTSVLLLLSLAALPWLHLSPLVRGACGLLLGAGVLVSGSVTGLIGLVFLGSLRLWAPLKVLLCLPLVVLLVGTVVLVGSAGLPDSEIAYKLYVRSLNELGVAFASPDAFLVHLPLTLFAVLLVFLGVRAASRQQREVTFVLVSLGLLTLRMHHPLWTTPLVVLMTVVALDKVDKSSDVV